MSQPETGPIYGVTLIQTLPLGSGAMLQQMPNRHDLSYGRFRSERLAAGYEVLLSHYHEAMQQIQTLKALVDTLEKELDGR